MKKLCVILIIAIIVTALSVPAFADSSAISDAVYSKLTTQNGQLYVTITRPDSESDLTFKKSYIISGQTDLDGIWVKLLRYDKSEGRYVDYANTDGASSWKIGSSGIFMKEVELKDGLNDIRIVAYKEQDLEEAENQKNANKKTGIKLQISDFAITLSNENFKDKIINNALKAIDFFMGKFK